METLSIKEKMNNGLPIIMPSRFMRITFVISNEVTPIVIEGSANFHPYIDSAGNYFKDSSGAIYSQSAPKARIVFESIYDESIMFPNAKIKIYNLPFVNSPLETLDFKSTITIEAGYNGFNLETLFEGYLLAKPFMVSEKDQNYTCFQLTTRQEKFKNTKVFNIGLNEIGDKKIKHFLNQINQSKEIWGNFKINLPTKPEINELLEKEINISAEYSLQEALEFLGNILELKFVYYNGKFESFYIKDCKKAVTGNLLETEISSDSILLFEDIIKEREKSEDEILEIKIKETAEYFEKAEEFKLIETSSDLYFQGISVPNSKIKKINAVLNLLIASGKPELGQTIKFKINKIERKFTVKSIACIGDTHGLGDDFKIILELV